MCLGRQFWDTVPQDNYEKVQVRLLCLSVSVFASVDVSSPRNREGS